MAPGKENDEREDGGLDDTARDVAAAGSDTESLNLLPALRHGSSFENDKGKDANKKTDPNGEEEPTIAEAFTRAQTPESSSTTGHDGPEKAGASAKAAIVQSLAPRKSLYKMNKFSLYETASRFYVVGGDATEKRYRILKIDRNADEEDCELSITDDKMVYTKKQMHQLLDTIEDGNRGTGGMKLRCTTWGLLGFIRFTGPYYMLLITKKSTVAMIGGHYVYQVEGTELVPLTPAKYKTDNALPEEARYLSILHNLDLNRSFYFSYSYDITRTLQHNIIKERNSLHNGTSTPVDEELNSMFVWNSHLLQSTRAALKDPYDWCRPIIHGHVDQASVSTYGRTAYMTIIARRSRYFAGARFLKRGANDLGYVANDVETEQIVSEALTTSFHGPGGKLYASPSYTSYVQHRGSIPLYWTQDNTGVTPKPPINLNLIDPFYSAAALHFDDLFERYGAPIYVLNLVKSKERQPRESKLLDEYRKATTYLNQFLPNHAKIIHEHMDMSRADKTPGQDVIRILEDIADNVMTATGFFHNGDGHFDATHVQNGAARTNCIDCLDRTNAAQFIIGKKALGHQLHALGIIQDKSVEFDTDVVNLLTHMYHAHGDTIAMQYGGSQLVNTMETYRKVNQWTSHSRDMIESFKRYYTNSFVDGQRQEAYNLFLGNYIYAEGQPMLWDLSTDYYLHHVNPRDWLQKKHRSYISWFDPKHLRQRTLPEATPESDTKHDSVSYVDDYWLEYYRPLTLSSLQKLFSYKMNSTFKYTLAKPHGEPGSNDLSPFRVRHMSSSEHHEKQHRHKKSVTIADRLRDEDDTASTSHRASPPRLSEKSYHTSHVNSILRGSTARAALPNIKDQALLEKSKQDQQTFTSLVSKSLQPSVSLQEADDYINYVNQSQNLPLILAAHDEPLPPEYNAISDEYMSYVDGSTTWQKPPLALDNTSTMAAGGGDDVEDLAVYMNSLLVADDPLTVKEEDVAKKRYKAYGKWLRGKSLFKQQPID